MKDILRNDDIESILTEEDENVELRITTLIRADLVKALKAKAPTQEEFDKLLNFIIEDFLEDRDPTFLEAES